MAKHKLYRQFENASPLNSSLSKEISPVRDVHRNTSDTVALVRYKMVKSKCAEKSANDVRVTSEKTNFTFSDPLPGGDCASDSDSDGLGSFCGRGPKLPYSAKEDEWILKFVLKGQNVFKVGSLSLWKHLENKKENPKRTYQSLKNRFLRGIKPHLFTRYRHLITSDTEIERILAKFPELKCKVGRVNTLSRIQLPVRNQNSKSAEGGLVNGFGENVERVAKPSTSTSGPANGSFRREPILNLHDFSNFERKVTIRDKSLAVSVNFRSKEQLHEPVTPSIGIYETYNKFKKKNKLVLCSACGRYNRPKKNKSADSSGDGESTNFSARRDVLGANSLGADPGKSSVTNSGSPSSKRRKVEGSGEPPPRSPFSPSLLRGSGEELGVPVGWGSPKEPPETSEVGQAPDAFDFDALCQEAGSAAPDGLRDTDDELDSIYDDTVTDFRKLIENEEERLLVRKCLYGRGGILGLSDCVSPSSLESYFVELSPNLETPELTTDYSSQSPARDSEGDNASSLLARNMMKMLEESKTSKES